MNSNPRTEWLRKPDGLAERLRALRVNAETFGSARAFAEAADMTPSKVSRIENGVIFPSRDDIRTWVSTAGADSTIADELVDLAARGEVMWEDQKRILRAGLTAAQANIDERVAESDRLAFFETAMIPGPLQTAGYARALLPILAPETTDDDLATAVAKRERRWEAIYDPGKQWELLMVETVLHLWPGPDSGPLMRAQLGHIQSVLSLENVRVGVIPFHRELSAWPSNSFALYGDDYGMVEMFTGADNLSDEKVAEYWKVLERLWTQAVEDVDDVTVILERARAATR